MVRAFFVRQEALNSVPRVPRNDLVPPIYADHSQLPSGRPRRRMNAVASHSVERHSVYRLEQLPVEKARYAAGGERCYLAEGALTSAVPQPRVTREPSDTPQHQFAGSHPDDAPPIDERSRHHSRGPLAS